jgi:CSLREA domain-containing protein
MVDLLLDVDASSSPAAIGQPLAYTLSLTQQSARGGRGADGDRPGGQRHAGCAAELRLGQQQRRKLFSGGRHCDLPDECAAGGETAVIDINVTPSTQLAAGERLETEAAFQLNQPNQAETQGGFELTTVVAPADFIVTTVADAPDADPGDGQCRTAENRCSLRAAIEQANATPGHQTIALDYQTYLLDAPLVDYGDVTLIGLGQGETILAGQGNGRILTVNSGVNVSLNNLTLTRGAEPDGFGGGVLNSGR